MDIDAPSYREEVIIVGIPGIFFGGMAAEIYKPISLNVDGPIVIHIHFCDDGIG